MRTGRAIVKYGLASLVTAAYGGALYKKFTEEEPPPPVSKEKFAKVVGVFIGATLLIAFL